MQPKEKAMHCDMLVKPWEIVVLIFFMINNENLLCIVDYYNKFPVVKKVESMLAKDLIQATKVVFAEIGIPPKKWFQMQAQILFQNNLRIFADTWIKIWSWHHHITNRAMNRWRHA